MNTRSKYCIPAGSFGVLIVMVLIGTTTDVAPSDNPLEGSTWTILAYGDLNEPTPLLTEPERRIGPYQVTFLKEGGWRAELDEYGVRASDGCQDSEFVYAMAPDGTLLTDVRGVTLIECDQFGAELPHLVKMVEGFKGYEFITDDSLHIYSSGFGVLVMTRSATSNKADGVTPFSSSVRFTSSHPNPFSDSATLQFSLDHSGPVRLAVYDVIGREVAVLLDDNLPAGEHSVIWNAEGVPAGQYVARLAGTNGLDSRQLTLVR